MSLGGTAADDGLSHRPGLVAAAVRQANALELSCRPEHGRLVRRRRVVLVAVAGAASLAGGCSGNSNASNTSPTTIATTTKPITTTSESKTTSTIDIRMQHAAEEAIASVAQPVDIVAIRASTGEIVAYAGRGGGLTAADPLTGRYPTGSVFKIVTAAALIDHGSSLSSPATCPASTTIGGRAITTFDGRVDSISNLADAFVHSCNTAFAILGSRLPDAAFAATAAELGLGVELHIGRPAFGGTVATPSSAFERATIASDGGTTVASPLALARVAAAIDAGHVPDLTLTTPSVTAVRPAPLPGPVLAGMRSMMADAVTTGTASGAGLPAGTRAKTGTAKFTNAPAPRTIYAWLVGYHGDIAFAVLVVGGAKGGSVAGPVAARFLAGAGS